MGCVRPPDGTVRKKRRSINAPREAHEITCTCFRRLRLLGHERTRRWLIESLDDARRRLELTLWAYVIMPDHFHVLFFPERHEYDMGVILKAIKQPLGQRAIAWLRRNSPEHLERLSVRTAKGAGHRFFQPGGGYDQNLFRAEAMWKSVNYLHMNRFGPGWWRARQTGSGRAPGGTRAIGTCLC